MTKKEIIAKLKEAGVDFDSSLTATELEEKFADVLTDEDSDGEEGEPEAGMSTGKAPVKSGSSKSIQFKIRNANSRTGFSVRTFSEATHGADFEELAKSFEEANTHKRPKDTSDLVEVKQINAFNNSIKHPIIGKHAE